MRTVYLGHLVDVVKGAAGSLIAAFLLWLLARHTRELAPTFTVSAVWLAVWFVVTSTIVVLLWLRLLPSVTVYEAGQPPMEWTGGEVISDAGAQSQRVWHAVGEPDRSGPILYGPYRKLRAGTYLARFHLKARRVEADGSFIIDIAHSRGDSQALTLPGRGHPLTLDTQGRYQYRVERFSVHKELAKDLFEWRVRVLPGAEVWVDTITLVRLG